MLETWSRLSDAPFARVNHQAIILNDFLYVFGGFNSQLKDLEYCIHQLDVFKWDINNNHWEEVKYPLCLKSWDCLTNFWGCDPLISADGSIQPTLRFGHTVVAWRGRGWLFGGQTQEHVCSNQLYMFYPGRSLYSSVSGMPGDSDDPLWAEVVGAHGAIPTARDGHAATVMDDSMFIFGGYEDVFNGYDNLVYRLDFLSWTWTRIQIVSQLTPSPPSGDNPTRDTEPVVESGRVPLAPSREQVAGEADAVEAGDGPLPEVIISTRVPLPRDFACLMNHHGRIFLFGGRSEYSSRSRHDVYDSALWELVPVASQQPGEGAQQNHSAVGRRSEATTTTSIQDKKSVTSCSRPVSDWKHMAWEEESGNWENSRFWATSSARPSCLWGRFSAGCGGGSSSSPDTQATCSASGSLTSSQCSCSSRWATSEAVWQRRHLGHGLQMPDQLLPRLLRSAAAHHSSSTSSTGGVGGTSGGGGAQSRSSSAGAAKLMNTSSPYGRRSLSHWCYGGYLYVAFGTVRCQTGDQWQLHYEDVWRFHLATDTWSLVSYSVTPTGSDNNNRDGVRAHRPSARRRAVACLHLPRPSPCRQQDDCLSRPRVFLFGGTQPCLLTRHTDSSGDDTATTTSWTNPGLLQAQRCLSGPLRFANLCPRLTDTQAIASLARQLSGPDVGVSGELLTQNRLLPLLSLRGIPRQLATAGGDYIGGIAAHLPPLRSPYVILLIDHTQNTAAGCGTLLHLVVVMPPLSTQATINSSPGNVPPLACLCVASLSDCVNFFHNGLCLRGSGFLSRLFTCSESDVGSRSSTSSLSEPIHYLSTDERVHLRTALHLALTAVDHSGPQRVASNRQATIGGGGHLPLRLSLVVQQTVMEPEMLDPMAVRYPSDLMLLPYANASSLATLLEQQIFYLPIREQSAEAGTSSAVTSSDPLDTLRSQDWFRRLPSSRLALYTALYLLRDAARLLSTGQPTGERPGTEDTVMSSGWGENVGSASTGGASSSSSSSNRRPRSSMQPPTSVLCYDCYFGTGSGDSPAVSPARVLIDASQLTLPVTAVGSSQTSTRWTAGEPTLPDGFGTYTTRSVASILTQHLLSHVRVGIELLPMMVMMDSQLPSSTSWPLELFVSRTTSLAPIPSASSSVSFSSSLLVPQTTIDLGLRNELTGEGGQRDCQDDAEMLEEQDFSGSAGHAQQQQPVDFSTSSAADWNSQLPTVPHGQSQEQQQHPQRQQARQPAVELPSADAGIDAQVEAEVADTSLSSSMSGSLNESAADQTSGSVFCVPGIGVLVKGKERLVELNDCYVMHLDTTLYDVCLRRLRAIRPSIPVLLTLPSRILHDLAALHYTSGLPECSGREANSG